MGWIGVVTNDGNALLTQWAGGNETLYITRATVGDAFTQEANMRMAKGLQNQRDTAHIFKNEIAGTSARKIKIRIRPMMHVGYIAHEIGIWGKIGAGGMETLLALYQDKDEGVSVPDGMIFALCILGMIVYSFYKKMGSIFSVSLVALIINVFALTIDFWKSIPWWLYMLTIGIALISFAIYNETNNKKSVDAIKKIKDKLMLKE